MQKIRLADYCCQGGEKIIDRSNFIESDLMLSREGNRELIFCPLGNRPRQPKLALVGITPGGQSKKFAELLKHLDVESAARVAAFAGAQETIKKLLGAHGFLDALGIQCPPDLNESDDVFTTSLVKCCLRVDGNYKYAAPDIAASRAALHCLSNRFIKDIEAYSAIQHIVIFGEPGWDAVNSLPYQGISIRQYLERRGLTVLNMPHFAQNFQQRAIYMLSASQEEAHFQNNPKHRPYRIKAAEMRRRTVDEVKRLKGSNV